MSWRTGSGPRHDLSAFALLFPPTGDPALGVPEDKWIVFSRFWVPEEDILRRGKRDRVPYATWRDQGFPTAMPGNVTDLAFVEAEIIELAARFDLRELAYDRTFAGEIVQHLQEEGLNLVQFGQDFLSMAAIRCCAGTPRTSPCAMIPQAISSPTRNQASSQSSVCNLEISTQL